MIKRLEMIDLVCLIHRWICQQLVICQIILQNTKQQELINRNDIYYRNLIIKDLIKKNLHNKRFSSKVQQKLSMQKTNLQTLIKEQNYFYRAEEKQIINPISIQKNIKDDSESQDLEVNQGADKISLNDQWIVDPYKYLDYCTKNKKIKVMNQQNPIFPNVYLQDISLHYKGPMQDKAYSKNYSYYINIRRGNTLCQIYHQQDQQQNDSQNTTNQITNNKQSHKEQHQFQLFFCKRGMKKFYDLQPQYLSTQWKQKLTSHHLKYRRRIFEKIDELNFDTSKVHLYSIYKQNGQHCQITYIKKLQCWLFGSKNVSILIRNQQDFQKYDDKIRYYWAKIIGKDFLKMLKSFKEAQIEKLKEELDSKTLLGEHCGMENHQHITKYEKVEIIFYAIVEKNTEDHCLPVDYCQLFLNKFNFKMSKLKSVTNLKDKNSTYQAIYSLLKQTAQGTMDQFGQGSVLYVVQQKQHTQKTISMCKLKTCEYLILRRLRQMLKLNVQRKSTANSFQKFKFDIKNLVANYFVPPKQLDFYFKLARQAFNEASKDKKITQNYLRYKFVDFMDKICDKNQGNQKNLSLMKHRLNKKVVVICLPRFSNSIQKYAKTQSIPFQYMFRCLPSNVKSKQSFVGSIHMLHMIPKIPDNVESFKNLQILICQYKQSQVQQIQSQLKNCKDFTKSHLITFIKNQNVKKSLQLLIQKINLFKQSLIKNQIKFTIVPQQITDKDQHILKNIKQLTQTIESQQQSNECKVNLRKIEKQKQNKLFILYPMLLPGSGKSTLSKQLQTLCIQNNFPFSKIEGDQTRSKFMEQKLKQKSMSFDLQTQQFNEVFSQVKQLTKKSINSKIIEKIKDHGQNSRGNQILFIDKIFGPDKIESQIELICEYGNVRPIILIGEWRELRLRNLVLPFSIEYLLICLKRCIERQEHLTMTRKPDEICSIFIWYLKCFSNCSLKKVESMIKKKDRKISMIEVKTVEQGQIKVDKNLKRKLEQCIESNRNKDKMMELIQQMYKNSEEYLKDRYLQKQDNNAAISVFKQIKKLIINPSN